MLSLSCECCFWIFRYVCFILNTQKEIIGGGYGEGPLREERVKATGEFTMLQWKTAHPRIFEQDKLGFAGLQKKKNTTLVGGL